tara:strand:+ start:774 stop:1508 length:735 start_codon:yes stop_codon:yes gene_type:complete
MRLAICSFYDKNISTYAYYTDLINKYYCNKYHYTYISSSNYRVNHLSPHYERYALMLEHIRNYDWIMWIDADAFFYKDAEPLEKVINHVQHSHKCILSLSIKDYFINHCENYYINNGVFILKNCKENISFLNKMINCEDIKEIAEKQHYIYDQSVFRYLYCNNYENFKNNSLVLNYGILQHFYEFEKKTLFYKPYILHMAGQNNATRRKIVLLYYYLNLYWLSKILLFVFDVLTDRCPCPRGKR